MPGLVPNRDCGKCTVCCTHFAIDEPDFQKMPGTTCGHCRTGHGCQIYERRPDSCSGFFCGWRVFRELDDKWRPDKSGVILLIQMTGHFVPAGYQTPAFQFLIYERRDIVTPQFVNYTMHLVGRRFPVHLAMRGPEGFSDVSFFMNERLMPAVAGNNRAAFTQILRSTIETMPAAKFAPVVLMHGHSPAPT
jgi:hypothetical protein